MRILVVDDKNHNIESAEKTLQSHEVVTARNIDEAESLLKSDLNFEAGLLDLYLPVGPKDQHIKQHYCGESSYLKSDVEFLPAGIVFALALVNADIPVAIVTDSDHHSDWLCNLLDIVQCSRLLLHHKPLQVIFVEARGANLGHSEDGSFVKDWAEALDRLKISFSSG